MDRFDILTSPLEEFHQRMGAKMSSFGGWRMPLSFVGIRKEHASVRESVGVFDVSHLGRVVLSGSAASDVLSSILTIRADLLAVGSGAYCLMLNQDAGIEEDLIVLRQPDRSFLLLVNAANRLKVISRLDGAAGGVAAAVEDITLDTAMIAPQGPMSGKLLEALGIRVSDLPRYGLRNQSWRGSDITASRTGYTGELGYELILPAEKSEEFLGEMISVGEEFGLLPCGLGARDTLRTEMGYPLWGNDIGPGTTPYSAGLMFAVDLSDHEFEGRSMLIESMSTPTHLLTGLILSSGIARPGDRIVLSDESTETVTSGTFSPTLMRGIALGYLPLSARKSHSVQVNVRGRLYQAEVVGRPIYRSGGVHG